ncbi:hypothetical protein RUND412_009731 [Rhizina undulata]
MLGAKLSRVQRLEIIIAISLTFFIAEISVGFYTRSLALVADAFHYATNAHQSHHHASFSVKNGRDHGMLGVLIHIIGDAINNIGVIVAALIIWLTKSNGRYYADPGISLAISVMILASALPLVKNSGWILLESAPLGLNLADVQHDIETVPGVIAVHELHVWRLNQQKSIASAHIVTSERSLEAFMRQAQLMGECLHAYGIHSVTLQPELAEQHHMEEASSSEQSSGVRRRVSRAMACQIKCGIHCEDLTCCG